MSSEPRPTFIDEDADYDDLRDGCALAVLAALIRRHSMKPETNDLMWCAHESLVVAEYWMRERVLLATKREEARSG